MSGLVFWFEELRHLRARVNGCYVNGELLFYCKHNTVSMNLWKRHLHVQSASLLLQTKNEQFDVERYVTINLYKDYNFERDRFLAKPVY